MIRVVSTTKSNNSCYGEIKIMESSYSSLSFVHLPSWSIGNGITKSLLLLSQLQKTKENSTQDFLIHFISTDTATNRILECNI